MRVRRPSNCSKSCANGLNIVARRFGDHWTKEMLGVVCSEKFDQFQNLCSNSNNTKHHATEFMAVKMSRKRSGFVIYSYIKDSAFLELKRDANF